MRIVVAGFCCCDVALSLYIYLSRRTDRTEPMTSKQWIELTIARTRSARIVQNDEWNESDQRKIITRSIVFFQKKK